MAKIKKGQTLSHNVVSSTPLLSEIERNATSVVIGTDCIGSGKSNYHTITATTAPTRGLLVLYVIHPSTCRHICNYMF